ncbi:MAG: glycosyltransferase family 9 protein [Candidatus Velthaea sp.]
MPSGTRPHIVLSRTDRVGDLILSTPAIATMRRSFPDARITMVCSRYNSVVVARSTDVDSVVKMPSEVKPEMFGRRFANVDLAIALAPRALDMRIVAATRAPRRIGYTYARRYLTRVVAHRWLSELLISEADPQRAEHHPTEVVRHEVDQLLALAQAAGAREIVRDLVVRIDEGDRAQVRDLPSRPIVVHIGKRWGEAGSTPENLVQLFADLRALGRPLVATYGDDGRELAALVRERNAADRLMGDLAFEVWAATFERAACVVTIDTGATHVASAMKRPTVVLFEYRYFHLSSQEWSPYRVPNAVLRKPRTETDAALRASRAQIVEAVATLL